MSSSPDAPPAPVIDEAASPALSSQEDELQMARTRIVELERELTEQRAELGSVENTLRLANDYLSDLLSAVSDALVVIDREHIILTANRAALQLLGYQDHELLGEQLHAIAPTVELDLARLTVGSDDAPQRYTNVGLRSKDGRHIAVIFRVSRVQDAYGDVVFACTATDMSERLRLENELHHAQRLESLGQLSAGVAHEINNPLGYVMGNLDYLRDEMQERVLAEIPDARAAIEQAYEGAIRVREVVGDLLAFARTGDERLESVELRQVLESTLRLATGQIKGRARLTRQFDSVPRVLAQRARLGQVFLNLIMNAIQALGSATPEHNQLHLQTSVSDDRVVVEVRDNGSGIPPDVRAHIFEPFFTTKPTGVGTGLGLSICHGIIKRFGGDITVDSEVGRGTSFFVYLQAAPPQI